MATGIAASISTHVTKALEESATARIRKQERARKAGRLYQEALNAERQARRNSRMERFVRALALPSVDATANVPTQRVRHRRTLKLREKRRTLMDACVGLERAQRSKRGSAVASLELEQSVENLDPPKKAALSSSERDRYEELLGSSHLSQLCLETSTRPQWELQRCPKHSRSTTRRLQHSLAKVEDSLGASLLPVAKQDKLQWILADKVRATRAKEQAASHRYKQKKARRSWQIDNIAEEMADVVW